MKLSASSHPFPQIAGEITAQETWNALAADADAVLVDVRTAEEWQETGVPDLNSLNKKTLTLSWRMGPGRALNPQFATALQQAIPDSATPVYFLCRSGGRSLEAAQTMAQFGYARCYNVAGGFTHWLATALPRSNA